MFINYYFNSGLFTGETLRFVLLLRNKLRFTPSPLRRLTLHFVSVFRCLPVPSRFFIFIFDLLIIFYLLFIYLFIYLLTFHTSLTYFTHSFIIYYLIIMIWSLLDFLLFNTYILINVKQSKLNSESLRFTAISLYKTFHSTNRLTLNLIL